ncbi:hypothetical protein ACOSQ3_008479 [Xanthoceras sorbifolium]
MKVDDCDPQFCIVRHAFVCCGVGMDSTMVYFFKYALITLIVSFSGSGCACLSVTGKHFAAASPGTTSTTISAPLHCSLFTLHHHFHHHLLLPVSSPPPITISTPPPEEKSTPLPPPLADAVPPTVTTITSPLSPPLHSPLLPPPSLVFTSPLTTKLPFPTAPFAPPSSPLVPPSLPPSPTVPPPFLPSPPPPPPPQSSPPKTPWISPYKVFPLPFATEDKIERSHVSTGLIVGCVLGGVILLLLLGLLYVIRYKDRRRKNPSRPQEDYCKPPCCLAPNGAHVITVIPKPLLPLPPPSPPGKSSLESYGSSPVVGQGPRTRRRFKQGSSRPCISHHVGLSLMRSWLRLPMGSLRPIFLDKVVLGTGQPIMEWETRLRIAIGSAKGLAASISTHSEFLSDYHYHLSHTL